jgi:hypothetical protein
MSEPRDLMVRLLSMGTSRFREAFAHATRGTIFSQNKFGIRHFGSILYEPLNEIEFNRASGMRNALSDTQIAIGQGDSLSSGIGNVIGGLSPFSNNANQTGISLTSDIRIPTVGIMRTLWANFNAQRDIELFKRNIYPGNGTGVAQFLGGDLGDGWTNAATLTPEDMPNPRLEYLSRLTDRSWNDLIQKYDQGDNSASAAIDTLTSGGEARSSGETAANLLSGGLLAAGAALAIGTGGIALPVIGGTTAAAGFTGLLGSLSGRGGVNIWKTFGLVSDLDDDMPGFDEVSFRAQTYMKSVWELFQLSARLLPNYIVAVRPFEDRSTVFYGKPHWLYTSGVVPVTTGFPNEKKAVELGLKTPSYRSPDYEFTELLDKINKSSNPMADFEAFKNAQNPSMTLESIVKRQAEASDIYAPAGILKGKVVNITDPRRLKYYDAAEQKVLSEIPKNKGYVTVGFHLPIDPMGDKSEVEVDSMKSIHKEIPEMPLRFSFPYFTDRVAGALLLDYAFYALSNNRSGEGADRARRGLIHDGDKDFEKFGYDNIYVNLIETEASLLGASTTDNNIDNTDSISINLGGVSFTSQVNPLDTFGSDNFIFDISSSGVSGKKSLVRMPLPSMENEITGIDKVEGSWEYEYINQNKIHSDSPFSYRDWGSPSSALDEQFYIAMRWPYEIIEDKNDPIFKSFKEKYFGDRSDNEFYGTPADYKNRKVLVYSPITQSAVVCKPAYFLWGTDKADLITGNGASGDFAKGRNQDHFINFKNDSFSEVDLAAVVSPDAAYYLGVMHLTGNEKEYFDSDDAASQSARALTQSGLAPVPMPRDCYFTFVDDSIPLGVVTTIYNPINEFKYSGANTNSENDYFIGFGKFQTSDNDGKLLVEDAIGAGIQRNNLTGASADILERQAQILNERPTALKTQFREYIPVSGTYLLDGGYYAHASALGGNILPTANQRDGYFDYVLSAEYDKISREALYDILDSELTTTGSEETRNRKSKICSSVRCA